MLGRCAKGEPQDKEGQEGPCPQSPRSKSGSLAILAASRLTHEIPSTVLFRQQPESGNGRFIFAIGGLSFRGALLCTVAHHQRSYHAIHCFLPLRVPRLIFEARWHDDKIKACGPIVFPK